MKKKVVDPRFTRGRGDYARVIQSIMDAGHCPFCPENFIYHRKPILQRRGRWFITRATWPYPNARHHFILLGTKHIEQLHELSSSDWQALSFLLQWAVKTYRLKGGGITMRFGDTAYTGATVCHLHAHLIVPTLNQKTKTANTVYFPIG